MSDEDLLFVDGISASIGQFKILHDISLRVRAGVATAILGRNGVGKTTTLRTILGFITPRTGAVRFRGQMIGGRAPESIARLGVAYVPERRGIFGGLTVAENMRLAHGGAGRPDRALDLFPALRSRMQDKAGQLSGGQQQMLAVGRALLQEPDLLILDEPTQGLAPLIVEEMVQALHTLADQTTLLVVEQNLDAAIALTSRFVIIDDGRTVTEGATAEIDASSVERYLALGDFAGEEA